MRKLIFLLLLLTSCSQVINDPINTTEVMAKCHYGITISFCIVTAPKGYSVISNSGLLSSTLTDLTVGSALMK